MATSAYASTSETTNYNKTCRVLLGPCSDQLRDVLRRRVDPVNFPHVIRQNRSNLPRLTPPQIDLILPRTGHYSGDYSDIDISLLYLLLRNVCNIQPHINGWGKSPAVTDHSLAASIERIHEARNKMGHPSSASLSDTDFTDIWSYIKDAVKSVDAFLNNGNKYEKEMDFLFTETMDPEQDDFYREQLRKQVETWETVMLLQVSVNDQREDIQDIQTNQHELHRQLTHQHGGIQDLRSQQQELHAQLTDQQGGIQDLWSQQQELHTQFTDQQGGIQVLRFQQQELNRQLTHQQGSIQVLQSQQQELQRQQTDQHTTLTDRLQVHSTQISDLAHRILLLHVIPENDITTEKFRKMLYKINYYETQRIPVSPLQKTSTMPIEELFAPVSIRENLEYRGKGRNIGTQQKRTKPVNCPDDMFLIDGDTARNVYMLGDAAIGKSVFCLRLVENWCKANNPNSTDNSSTDTSNPWIRDLKIFDFLFLVQLRHVDSSRTSVIDMICYDVFQHHPGCHDVIHCVISDEKYQCLIVIDGLDEWKISDDAKRELKVEGLPNTENMANCTFVWSMRPWVMEKFSDSIRDNDRVVEIQGLNYDSINIVIEKILVNFYELDKKSLKYTEKVKEITEKSQDSNLKSIMEIPLMAIACVQIWYEEKDAGKSMTSLYVALIEMVLRRSNQKSRLSAEIMNILSEESSKITNAPTILVQKKNIKMFISVLMKLGKVASEDLLSNQAHLVFSIEDLERCLQSYELEFALKSGLLSKCEAPGSCDDENISINFFHKSIQEFLAAMYIENHREIGEFCKHLSSIEVIMEFGNVLIFLSGLDTLLGSSISQHIVNVANGDTEICKYRTFSDTVIYINNKAVLLYKLQTICYREMTYSQTNTDNTQQAVSYHVSDVLVDDHSDTETIRTSVDILTHHHADITSLILLRVPTDVENGVTDSLLTQYLDRTVSLQLLWISGHKTERTLYTVSDSFSSLTALVLFFVTLTPDAISTLHTTLQSNKVIQSLGLGYIECQVNQDQGRKPASLSGLIQILPDLPRLSTLRIAITNKDDKPVLRDVLSRLSHLHGIAYFRSFPDDDEYDNGVVQTLCLWSGLRWLRLTEVRFGDSGLQLSRDMLHIENVWLDRVEMSSLGWTSFIQSVIAIKHKLDVVLHRVDIDERSIAMVRQSPLLNVSKIYDRSSFHFTRV